MAEIAGEDESGSTFSECSDEVARVELGAFYVVGSIGDEEF